MGSRLARAAVSVVLVLSVGSGAAAGDGGPSPSAVRSPTAAAAQRAAATDRLVVWDLAPRGGTDLRAARLDGTSEVRLYSSSRRRVFDLSLSRDGARVAFSPERRGLRAQLLVVPTAGGRSVQVLRGSSARSITSVSAIGWSASSEKLVFEAGVSEPSAGEFDPAYLFTVNVDGTGLRRLRQTDDGTGAGTVPGAIAWTRTGIYYQEGGAIRRLKNGRSQVLVPDVVEMYPSGDNETLFYRTVPRYTGSQLVQRIYRAATGPRLEPQLVATLPDPVLGLFIGFRPDRDGSRLIGLRSVTGGVRTDTVTYNPTEPRDLQVVTLVGGASTVTWY